MKKLFATLLLTAFLVAGGGAVANAAGPSVLQGKSIQRVGDWPDSGTSLQRVGDWPDGSYSLQRVGDWPD